MANEALMNLQALQQQTEQAQQAAEPLIQQAAQANVAPEQVALPGDAARAQGLISGIAARGRLKDQQDLDNQQRQQAFERQELLFQQQQDDRTAAMVARGNAQNQQQFMQDQAIFQAENVFRGEYQALVGPAIESLNAVGQFQSQMDQLSPAAGFNAARLFVRQLDQSMFASDELRAQISQAGLDGQIANWVNWAGDKGVFDQTSKAQMQNSMTALGEFFQDYVQNAQNQATILTENSFGGRLNPQNVITMDGYVPIDLQQIAVPSRRPGAEAPAEPVVTGTRTLPDGTVVEVLDEPAFRNN